MSPRRDCALTPKMRDAVKLLGLAWLNTGALTVAATQPCRYTDVPWINHATGRALVRLELAEIERNDPVAGPDEIILTEVGQRLAEGCRQCGRSELDTWPDGQAVTLVGCDICSGPACDEHCALSEGEWCCTDHDPDAGWDEPPAMAGT